MLTTSQYLTVDCFARAWACSGTYTLPEHAPQNRLRNGYVLVEVCQVQFSTLCPYAHQLLSTLLWTVSRGRGLVRIPPHSLNTLHKTVYETTEFLWRYVTFHFRVFTVMLTNVSVPTVVHFASSWACSDTYTLPERAPQICL